MDYVDYIHSLQEAIHQAHGCDSTHVNSVRVHEQFQGKTEWLGVVEVFDLVGHPTATACYAWGHAERHLGREVRTVIVLKISPIDSPRAAVRVSLSQSVAGR